MTKEEAIEFIIEEAKRGTEHAHTDFCEKYVTCNECPLGEGEGCRKSLFDSLIERLLKAEEHQKAETNLEHFRGNVIVDMPNSVVYFDLKNGWEESYSHHKDVIDWFLSPYEPLKYKLRRFEHDLLNFCKKCNDTFVIGDWAILMDMHDKGHFKDIPTDVPIRDILDNCEVTDNETD